MVDGLRVESGTGGQGDDVSEWVGVLFYFYGEVVGYAKF